MPNHYFQFKQFTVYQERSAMKVCTDACVFGAWVASRISEAVPPVNRVLDIGTGTGLLSLMIAQNTSAPITGIEIDPAAAMQAAENARRSPWHDNIVIEQVSLQEFTSNDKFGLIISNPPFYEDDLRSPQPSKNAAKHDSTLRFEELISLIALNLKEEGMVALLLPAHRSNYMEALAKGSDLFVQEKLLIRQSITHDPFRVALILSGKKTVNPVVGELSIHDGSRNYTPAFISLLEKYYLKL
jgi:tRNA1Val (adenine37-N6)-methyltransferase